MKKITKHLLIASLGLSAIALQSCEGKYKEEETKDTVAVIDTPAAAAVQVSIDQQLTAKVKDAIKDFEGVSAKVDKGEITLTGSIKRDKLQMLMQIANSFQAKKINNKLTITN